MPTDKTPDLLTLAVAAAKIGVWGYDLATNEITWTTNVGKVFGLPSGQIPSDYQAFLGLIHPDDRQAVVEAIQECVTRGAEYAIEHRLIWPDRSVHWASCRGDVIRNEQGEPLRMVGTVMDITERKTAEQRIEQLNQELRHRVQEFETLIETAPIGIGIATDASCAVIVGNREFNRMLGCAEAVNISKSSPAGERLPFHVLRDGHEVRPDMLPMQRACREGRPVLDEELQIVRADGTTLYELARAAPLTDVHGRVRGCIGAFLDITERKRAEETLKEVQQRLIESLQERERLSHNLHDNVLQSLFAIGLRVESVLVGQTVTQAVRDDLKAVVGNLNQVIEDVRSYLEGQEPMRFSAPSLAENLTTLTARLNAIQSMMFRLEIDTRATQSLTTAQAEHLFYIAEEAMTNALRHSKGKNVHVALRLGEDTIILRVSDDGIGFDTTTPDRPNHGLHHMKVRAAKIGAHLEILSAPFLCTGIVLTVPAGTRPAA